VNVTIKDCIGDLAFTGSLKQTGTLKLTADDHGDSSMPACDYGRKARGAESIKSTQEVVDDQSIPAPVLCLRAT